MTKPTLSYEDRTAIDDLYVEYAWALDTGDTEGWMATFFDDASVWEDQPDGSTWKGEGVAKLREFILKYHTKPGFPGHQHRETTRLMTPDPEGRPDTWAAKSYIIATFFDVETHSSEAYWAGWYRDVVEKRDGEWKFTFRYIAPWKGEVLTRYAEQAPAAA